MDLIKEGPLGKDYLSQVPEKAEERPSSPQDCAICLEQISDKSFIYSCLHVFCFHCLLAWSKVKPECPLCYQDICSIIHNIRSISDYDEYHVTPPEPRLNVIVNSETPSGIYSRERDFFSDRRRSFSSRTTFISNAYSVPQDQSSSLVIPPYVNNLEIQTDFSRLNYFHNPYARYNRRNIYIEEIETHPPANGSYRECSPEFYRENEVQVHRLARWLLRELMELSQIILRFNHHELLRIILDMLPVYSINSTTFYSTVNGFLGIYTVRFIREFWQFAISPYEMEQYDRECVYFSQQRGSQLSFIDTGGRVNTEEVQIIPNSSNPSVGPCIDVNGLGASHLSSSVVAHSLSPLYPHNAVHSATSSTPANNGISPQQPIIHISDSENDDVPEVIVLDDSDVEQTNLEAVNTEVHVNAASTSTVHHSPENHKISPQKESSSIISMDSQFDKNCDKVTLRRSKRKHMQRYHIKSFEKHQGRHHINSFDSFHSVTSSSEDNQNDTNDSDWAVGYYRCKKRMKKSVAGRLCNKKKQQSNVDELKSKK